MYCVNCGVKLADTESKCPLCETPVCYPNFEPSKKTAYPQNKMPKTSSGLKALGGVIIILFLIPLVLSFFSDILPDGKINWFGFVAGGLMVGYVIFALPLWFKRPNPVVFVPCGFAATVLYLFYINLATNGGWFFSFALPVVGGLCLITSAVVTLLYYLKKGRLYIFGGALMLGGALIFLIEHLLDVTFGIEFIGWSTYPFAVLFLLGGLLIYLAINGDARETLERKFFF